jgi:hypothetical protein
MLLARRLQVDQVEHGSIKASYAIPPAASFVCNPTSIRVKTGKHTHTRYTYCATRRQGHQRLDCFQERFDNNLSQGVTSSSAPVIEHVGDVVHLELLSDPATTSVGTDEHSISVLFQNGVLRLYSQGLYKEENAVQLAELHSSAHCHDILTARRMTFDEVRGTTLKHRPDILASAEATSSFIFVLYRQRIDLKFTAHVGVWSVPLTSTASTSSRLTDITAIATYSLPDAQLWSQEADLQCSFNPKATSLLITGVKGVANFDFSSYSPRLTWEEHILDHGLSSARINNSFVATSSATSLTIHDPKYKSSRTVLDLTQIGKKRKREKGNPAGHGYVRIVDYFRELGKLVTVRRNHLLSFELSGTQNEAMLIDSIGCGNLNSVKVGEGIRLELEIGAVVDLMGIPLEQWTILQQKMIAAAEADDAAGFEAVALEAVQNPDSLDRLSEQQIEFLLSKIFRWTGDVPASQETQFHGQPHLQIAIPAFTVLSLLIDHGAVARHTVQYALKASHQGENLPHVEAGMIPAALIESDRTFVLLKNFLDTPALLDAPELAAIVGRLVKLVLLETYANRSAASQQMLDRDDVMDVEEEFDAQEAQATATSQGNLDATDTELTSVLRILVIALEKFARFGTVAIAEGLRTSLNRTEIGTLIQVLRQQLYEGQHTTHIAQEVYPSPPVSASSSLEDRVSDPVLSLDATSKILLGCVDAVGSLGFLADGSQDDFLARVIPELKSETALATQGLEEASYLRGILRETIRYAQSADKEFLGDSTTSLTEGAAPTVPKPGTIITIYSEPTIDQGDIETKSGILPLSLRAENTIALTKMRKGGGQVKDRSLREVREMENRNKGLYSFERLVL